MRFAAPTLLISLLCASWGWAQDPRLLFFAKQLAKSSDPRARSQAAFALANSGDPFAKDPLCDALDDDETLVRTAAAKGLELLQEVSAIGCLSGRKDPSVDVRNAIQRALNSLEKLRNQKPALYVMLGEVEDKGASLSDELRKQIELRLRKLLQGKGAVFAPPGETKAAAKTALKKSKLKGFYLIPTFSPVPNGLRMTVVCFNYPDKALQGEVSVKAGGASVPDLVRALIPKAIEDAAETFEWSP